MAENRDRAGAAAVDGEQLVTAEGGYVCSAGEWVVSRPGDSWAVPAEHFAQVYMLADDG